MIGRSVLVLGFRPGVVVGVYMAVIELPVRFEEWVVELWEGVFQLELPKVGLMKVGL